MAAQILSFTSARAREPATRDWSHQELAEFYRVESALLQAGLQLESERGVSDEGDPWFVFCRADTGEVFIHFARVDGWYVVDGAALGSPSRGRDFGALVRDLISSHPLATVRRPGTNVMLHPAALLIALVGAAFFHSGKAKAADLSSDHAHAADAAKAGDRRALTFNAGGSAPVADAGGGRAVTLDASEVAAVLTGVAIGLRSAAAEAATPAPASTPGAISLASLAPPPAATPIGSLGAVAGVLAALPMGDARAALTVMAVFHDLARTPTSTAAPVAAPVSTPSASTDAALRPDLAAAAPAAATPVTHDAAAPQLVVHLASGPLPQIEALALVNADGALMHVAEDRVVHVDQLPTALADMIAHGETVAATTAPATAPAATTTPATPDTGTDGNVTPPTDDHVVATGGDAHTGASSTGGGVDPHAAGTSPGGTSTAPTPPGGSGGGQPTDTTPPAGASSPTQTNDTHATAPQDTAAAPPAGHSAAIDAAVLAFVSEVTNVQVMISGKEVVFYDPAILMPLGFGVALDSITWRLEDGSSVSLVGTAPELHAFHGVG